MCTQGFVALRCELRKPQGFFRELITTRRTTRVAYWDPPSGSKNILARHWKPRTIIIAAVSRGLRFIAQHPGADRQSASRSVRCSALNNINIESNEDARHPYTRADPLCIQQRCSDVRRRTFPHRQGVRRCERRSSRLWRFQLARVKPN